jgi:hypothetical protein
MAGDDHDPYGNTATGFAPRIGWLFFSFHPAHPLASPVD